ncbi:Chromatin assembly factor 1, subunit A [Kappamyces sp. JEL0829]|nr:Chromatin assembly factor 1, subunit A [Kappamyces sp. JEL0829]
MGDQTRHWTEETGKSETGQTSQSLARHSKGLASTYFKDGKVRFKDENLPQWDLQPAFFIEMAAFFQTGTLTPLLIALLIPQHLELPLCVEHILTKLGQAPKEFVPTASTIEALVRQVADWVDYGIAADTFPDLSGQGLPLSRWDIHPEVLPKDLQPQAAALVEKRKAFQHALIQYYTGLQEQERLEVRKRKPASLTPKEGAKKPRTAQPEEKAVRKKGGLTEDEKLLRAREKEMEKEKREAERLLERERKEKEREEERERREEERERKEEEKLRKQAEKELLKEESKAKIKKTKEDKTKARGDAKGQRKLLGFFQVMEKKPSPPSPVHVNDFAYCFRPFSPKATAIVAPANKWLRPIDAMEFDDAINGQDNSQVLDYFGAFRKKNQPFVPGPVRCPKSMHGQVAVHSWKFLKFAEDVRPPYYGTWTKTSPKLSARHPFAQDSDLFDYEFDSEAEWEEEEPGEDLVSEPDEEDKDEIDEDADDGWLVPHGYLSDDEGEADPELEGARPKSKELKPKVISLLVPVLIGPSYSFEGMPPELVVDVLHDLRNPFDQMYVETRKKPPPKRLSPELSAQLVQFLEQNSTTMLKLSKLAKEFLALVQIPALNRPSVEAEIKRVAKKTSTGWKLHGPIEELAGEMPAPESTEPVALQPPASVDAADDFKENISHVGNQMALETAKSGLTGGAEASLGEL